MFVASFYYLFLKLGNYHNGHIFITQLASLGLYLLILVHNFYAYSSGLGGGGLGLKTARA
jgi:hypothetical protein